MWVPFSPALVVVCVHTLGFGCRVTSHTWLRARDHYTSSTLIGGKGRAGPSSLHTTLEGTTKYVKSTWSLTRHRMVHVSWSLGLFSKPPLGGRPNTKSRHHGTPNAHNRWLILFYHGWGPAWMKNHKNSIWLWVWSHMTSNYTLGPRWP